MCFITAEKSDALIAPNTALRFYLDENQRYKEKGVWILKNSIPERITIKEGISDDNNTEIISDKLKAGDEIIISKKLNNEKAGNMRLRMPR